MEPPHRPASALPPAVAGLFVLLAGVLLVLHVLAVRTETVNWDEFALLAKARATLLSGLLQGGGRPGLATLAALPAVLDCEDGVSAVRRARYLWIGFTLLMVTGLWALLRRACRRSAEPMTAATVGTGLLVLVPVFLRWSLQVRADHGAVAASLWAGALALGPRRRGREAFAAGLLLGVGYLFSQKAAYLALLVGLLALGDVLIDRSWRTGRELGRALLAGLGGLSAVVLYRSIVGRLVHLPDPATLQIAMSPFEYYRRTIGFNAYVGMLPTLVPHAVLALLLAAVTWRDRGKGDRARVLWLAWAVAGLGVAVGLFHAAAFPYFWMTLGIFPATALALGLDSILDLVRTPRERHVFVGLFGLVLSIPALRASVLLLDDSQAAQRDALGFVARNFAPADRGFHPESALFCRPDPEPFPTYFSQDITRLFYGAEAEQNTAAFIQELRKRPVRFIVSSFRVFQLPPPVQKFLAEHYLAYRDNVFVPGHLVEGPGGGEVRFDVVAGGRFRWWSSDEASRACVRVDGLPSTPSGTWSLEAGEHVARLSCAAQGWLALALRDPPAGGAFPPFYGEAMALENSGLQWSRR